MNRLIKWTILAGLVIPACHAEEYNGHFYGFFGMGAGPSQTLGDKLSYGGGGERFVWRNLTVGGDAGFMYPRGEASEGIGIVNVLGGWQFVNRESPGKLVPYVSGGWTIGVRSAVGHLANYGGGLNYWFANHVGAGVEVRDYEGTSSNGRFNTDLRFKILFR